MGGLSLPVLLAEELLYSRNPSLKGGQTKQINGKVWGDFAPPLSISVSERNIKPFILEGH